MNRLVVATTNAGKIAELTPLLGALGYEVCGLDAFPAVTVAVEDGDTFASNAEKKARHYAVSTGLPALADDSGLAVRALGGAPGVHSARFAGEDADDAANNALLLQRLAEQPDRRARFVCALCLVDGDTLIASVEGRCEGRILDAPRGAGGFGYDPLFVPEAAVAGGRSFAELSREAKSQLSHRGAALRALVTTLEARRLAGPGPGRDTGKPDAGTEARA